MSSFGSSGRSAARVIWLAAAGLIFGPTIEAQARDDCVLISVAKLPMTISRKGTPAVPMTIGGRPVTMLVDTGDSLSQLTRTAAASLGLDAQHYNPRHSHYYDNMYLDSFAVAHNVRLGGMASDTIQFYLAFPGTLPGDVDGAVSPDILQHFDIEFDFANASFSLYSREHCAGQFLHWTEGDYAKIDFSADQFGHIFIPIALDGKELTAIVDTTRPNSQMTYTSLVSKFGVEEGNPNLVRIPEGNGRNFRYPFKTLTIEGISVNNPAVEVVGDSNLDVTGDGRNFALGMDVLRRLHFYVSYGEHLIYATPASAH